MKSKIKAVLDEFKIEYFAVLEYSRVREIAPKIRERHNLLPKSVIVYLLPYYVSRGENLSAYATSRDYHLLINEVNAALIRALSEALPSEGFVGFGDHSPIDERSAAAMGGLGVLGDNGLLINEKYGSYVFIGEVLTTASPHILSAREPCEIGECIHCTACATACPTGRLKSKGSPCLSDVTQRKGELSQNEVEMMRKIDTVWGCDVCQEVCPLNKNAEQTPISFFHEERVNTLTGDGLNSLSDEELRTYAFGWRGRKTVARNLDLLKY